VGTQHCVFMDDLMQDHTGLTLVPLLVTMLNIRLCTGHAAYNLSQFVAPRTMTPMVC